MNIGISTGCLYPMLTEESVRTLLGQGFDLLEIFLNTFSELDKDYLHTLHTMLKQNEARVRSIHPFTSSYESFLLFSNYERRFRDGLDIYDRYYETAALLGADFVILHGLSTNYRSTLDDEEYCRRFSIMQEHANQFGVTLLQENVSGFRSGSNEFLRKMQQIIPEQSAFVCDTKQAFSCGSDPLTVVRAMGQKLRHVHISGSLSDHTCVLPGKGCFPIVPFLRELHRSGYDGDIIIEVYRFSYRQITELSESRQFLQQCLSEAVPSHTVL